MAVRGDGSAFPSDEQPAAIALCSGRAHPDTVVGLRRPGAETLWFRVRAEPLMQVGSSIPYMAASRFSPIAGRCVLQDDGRSRVSEDG